MQKFIAKGGVLTPNVTVASPTGTAIQIQNAAGQEVVNFVAETDKTLSIHSGAVSAKPALTITSGGIISNVAQATNVAALTRKDYVDEQIKVVSDKVADTTSTDARYLRLSGGTLTGSINISHAVPQLIFTESDQTPEKKYIFVSDGGGIRLNEDTTTGREVWQYSNAKDSIELYKPSAPSAGTTAASLTRKDYVDAEVTKAIASAKTAGDKDYVRVIGDAMTGNLVMDNTSKITFSSGGKAQFNMEKSTFEGINTLDIAAEAQDITSYSAYTAPVGSTVVSIAFNNKVGVAVGKSFVAYSTDAGHTWTRSSAADLISASFEPNYVSFANNRWFIGANGSIYYSTDDARNWIKATVDSASINYSAVVYYSSEYICGSTNGVSKSTDGVNWKFTEVGPKTPVIQYNAVTARSNMVIIAGTNGTTYSADATKAWTVRTGLGTVDINTLKTSGNDSYAFASDSSIYKSTDGTAWTKVTTPTSAGGQLYGLDFKGNFVVAGYGSNGAYHISDINGANWKSYSLNDNGATVNDVAAVDAKNVLMCTSSGKIYRVLFAKGRTIPFRVNSEGIYSSVAQSAKSNAFVIKSYVDGTFVKKSGDTMTGDLAFATDKRLKVNTIAGTANWDSAGNSNMIKMGTYDAAKGGDLLEIRSIGASATNRTSGFNVWTTKNVSNTPLYVGDNMVYHAGNLPSASDLNVLPGVATESTNPPLSATAGWHVIARVTLPQSASTARIDITGGTGFNVGQPKQLAMTTIVARTGNNNPKGIDVVVYETGGTTSIIKNAAWKFVSGNDYDIYVEANQYGNAGLIYRGQASGGSIAFTSPAANLGATKPADLTDGTIVTNYNTWNKPTAVDVEAVPLRGGTMTGTLVAPNITVAKDGKISLPTEAYSSGATIYATDGGQYGANLIMTSGGNTVLGSGESALSLEPTLGTQEDLYLTSDGIITFISGANDWTKRVATTISTNGRITSPSGITIQNTGGHVDLIDTGTSDKNWRLESKAGGFQITETGVATRVTVKAGGGIDVSGSITATGEIESKSSNSYKMIDGSIGTFWRKDTSDLYLMRTEAGKATESTWSTHRPFSMKLDTAVITLGEGVVVKKLLDLQGPAVLNTQYVKGVNDSIIMRDHGNGNVTLSASLNASAAMGDLYLGFNSTASGTAGYNTRSVRLESPMNWKGGTAIVDSDGGINSEALVGPIRTDKDAANVYSTVIGGTDGANRGRTIIAAGKSGAQLSTNVTTASKQVHIAGEATDGVYIHTGLAAWGTGTHKKIKFQDGNITLNDGIDSTGSLYFGPTTYATLSGGSLYLTANNGTAGKVVLEGKVGPVARVNGKDGDIFYVGNKEFYENTITAPAGVEASKYYPIAVTNANHNQRLYVSTRTDAGSYAMNNCSFDGIVRSGGWSDRRSYVDGVFTMHDVNERAIHSIWGPSENDGAFVIYVEGRAFPVMVRADYSANVACTGKDATIGSAVFKAGLTSAELDGATTINTKSNRMVNFDKGILTARYFNNGLVYHEGYKPASGDLNAVAKSGDTMTGALVVSVDSTLPIIAENGTNQAAFGCSITAGEYIFGGKAKSSSDYQHYIRLGNNKFQYYQAGTTYDVYHTGKKPGAADVGALALSGGTLTGDLVTKNIQLAATADVGLKNSSGTNVIRQSSTGHNVVVGNNTGELYLDFATKLYARQGTSTFEVYTTGNKPDAAAVGAVPTSRKVNNKALTADITLTAADVGALPTEGGTITGDLTIAKAINLNATGNVINTIGGSVRSNDTQIMSLDGKVYSFVTSPQDAHLCRNAYWDGASWKKYNNADTSNYIVMHHQNGLQYKTSAAGVSDPNQNSYNVYHTGYKPTADDVQAVPTSGDSLKADKLTVLKAVGLNPDYNTGQLEISSSVGSTNAACIGFHLPAHSAHSLQMRPDYLGLSVRAQGGGHGNISAAAFEAKGAFTFNGKTVVGGVDDSWLRLNPANSFTSGTHARGNFQTEGSIRAEGQMIINNDNPTLWFQDTDNRSAAIHCNTNLLYILRGSSTNASTWDGGPNGRHPMTLNLESGDVVFSGNVVAYSDARLKRDVKPLQNALDSVLQLNPVQYKRKGDDTPERLQCGFIAQELREVIPEVVIEQQDEDKTLAVDYAKLVAYMAGAIQELTAKVEQLEAKLKQLGE